MQFPPIIAVSLLALGSLFCSVTLSAQPSTVFTYQGRLLTSGDPAEGDFDFELSLWDATTSGTQISTTLTRSGVTVTNGLVELELDFGATAFDGAARWLQIGVQPSVERGGLFTTLLPRRAITPAPQAQYALVSDSTLNGPDGHSLDALDGDHVDAVIVNGAGAVGIATAEPEAWLHIVQSIPDFIIPRDTDGSGIEGPQSLVVSGSFAYVLDLRTSVLAIFDVSDPNNIVPRDADGTGLSSPGSVAVSGDFAYVVDSGTDVMAIFDVSDPDNIVPRDTDGSGLSVPRSVAVSGDFAYVVDSGTNVLAIFDVSNPDNIVPLNTIGTGLVSPRSVAVSGDFAYVVDSGTSDRAHIRGSSTGALAIFDVSDPNNIVPRDTDDSGLLSPRSIAVSGDFAYVVDTDAEILAIFDISDPDNIVPRDSNGTGLDSPRSVAVSGDFAYVADAGTNVLAIFDVSDPDNIVPHDTDGTGLILPVSVAVSDDFAYVVDISTGVLAIFQFGGEVEGLIVEGDALIAGDLQLSGGTNSVSLLLEADVDNSGESDQPSIVLSQDGGQVQGSIRFYESENHLEIQTSGPFMSDILLMPRDNLGIKRFDPDHPLHVGTDTTNGNGAHVTTGGAWTNGSSRAWKKNFRALDPVEVLNLLSGLSIQRWEYDGSDEGDHIGPTAEEFRAAFSLGHSDEYIATVDADGVAFAAIQGLNQKLERENAGMDAQIEAQQTEIDSLRAEIAELRALIEAEAASGSE